MRFACARMQNPGTIFAVGCAVPVQGQRNAKDSHTVCIDQDHSCTAIDNRI